MTRAAHSDKRYGEKFMADLINATEKSKMYLETVVKKNDRILIDTCSLLVDEAESFLANIAPVLQQEKKIIIVPYRVFQEVESFASDQAYCVKKYPNSPKLYTSAVKAKRIITNMHKSGLVEVFGSDSDNFADNVFLTICTQYVIKYNIAIITQDKNLSHDIINIGKSQFAKTKNKLTVVRINKFGYLNVYRNDHKEVIPNSEKFAITTEISPVEGVLVVSQVPGAGEDVTAVHGSVKRRVTLVKELASGGEGIIYTTNIQNVVAKIYKIDKINKSKSDKIELMITKKIEFDGLCFPTDCLYNSENKFVGYLMREARGYNLGTSVFLPYLKDKFPHWKKIDTVELCITILQKIKYLHNRNIIIGDINQHNILVVSPHEVYFVDTDSYQIEGYPCPVGTINFTAPEVQRKKYTDYLRTPGNEMFAVATLLFMIMLPGRLPYSVQGGSDQVENILNMDFAYPSGEKSTGKAPDGKWRYYWSHLPRFIKDDFYSTFRKDQEHSTEQTRFNTEDWLKKFENYRERLISGVLAEQDEMSIELFPTRFKKNPKAIYARCELCNSEADVERMEDGYCWDCLNDGEVYQCASCGAEMIYTNKQKLLRKSCKHDICKSCANRIEQENKARKETVYSQTRCPECGNLFEITQGEKEYFEDKGLSLPKRCKECRSRRSPSVRANTSTRRMPHTQTSVATNQLPRYAHTRRSSKAGLIWLTFLFVGLLLLAWSFGNTSSNLGRSSPPANNDAVSGTFDEQVQEPILTPPPTTEPLLHLDLHNLNITDDILVDMITNGDIPKNIESLDLSNNQINDTSSLQSLTNLNTLMLSDNYISDIEPLRQLPNLIVLFLDDNKIYDLAPLRMLESLAIVALSNNQIIDFEPLQSLENLTALDLGSNKVSDISLLQALTSLEILLLYDNHISDITPLQSLTSLTYLELSNNQVSDIAPLQSLTDLTYLKLSNNQLIDITPVQTLASLDILLLSDNNISDLTPLQSLAYLTEVDFSNNLVKDITSLIELANLKILKVSNNQINDSDLILFITQRTGIYGLPHVEIIN